MHSIEELRFAFEYDPLDGTLFRKVAGRSDFFGERPLTTNRVSYEGVAYRLTHLIWAIHFGKWPVQLIDHRDGDHANFKLDNLREATHQQNQFNKVGFGQYPKGVVFKRDANRKKPWAARIRINGKKIPIGSYETMEEAAEAYRIWADVYQGEFALHNS